MSEKPLRPRQSQRLPVSAAVRVKGSAGLAHEGTLSNISAEGCCVSFTGTMPDRGALVVLRLEGLEGLDCTVRWSRDRQVGLEFRRRLYGPVVEHLRARHGHAVQVGGK